MARDRNFQRKQKDARMPARDSHGEDRMAARQGEPDFDLRRARDAPSSGNSRNRRQAAPVQAETYGSDISAGHGDSNTAAQDSPTQVFPGQEPTGSEPYVPETGLKESGRGGQGQSNAAYRDSRQKDSGLESPGRRNSAYRDSRQEGPRQEGPERRNSAYQNFRQEESPQENSRQENPGRTAFAEHGPKGADSRYGKIFQEGAGAQKGEEKSGQAGHRSRTRQHGNKYQQRFQEVAKVEEPQEKPPEAAEGETKRPSKLEFTADELPPETADKKLTKARRKAERTAEKLERAENRLPTRRKLRMETSSDPDTGKAKKRLKFEKEVKSQRAHVKGPVPMRPVKAGANMAVGYAHKKIYQAENENVGIKAGGKITAEVSQGQCPACLPSDLA